MASWYDPKEGGNPPPHPSVWLWKLRRLVLDTIAASKRRKGVKNEVPTESDLLEARKQLREVIREKDDYIRRALAFLTDDPEEVLATFAADELRTALSIPYR